MAFLTYREPGAYSRYIDDPRLIRTLGLFRIPAIIGPGKDTIGISNQIITRGYSKTLKLAETGDVGATTIKLTTTDHGLIPSDMILITDSSDTSHFEKAVVVGIDGDDFSVIIIDTDLETVDGQGLTYTYEPETTLIKEISMKDKVIPAEDLVFPANIDGLDENGYPVVDVVTADAINGVGFAPYVSNYRPNVDYDANLVMDDSGNWYIKWLQGAYVVREDLAQNGRTNDITSGTANVFYVGHRGLVDENGDITDTTHYQDVIDSVKLEKYDSLQGAYVAAKYNDNGHPIRITYVDPANGKITLDGTPAADELQDGIYVTYYYKNTKPSVGEDFYISYEVQKSDEFYLPALYTDSAQIVIDFGLPNLTNSISLAAFLCLGGGADRVMMVQTKKSALDADTSEHYSSADDYRTAFSLLEAEEISVLVPLSVDEVVQSYAFQHCIKMTSMLNRKERMTIFTIDDSDFARKQDEIQQYRDIANGYEMTGSGERVILIAPPKVILPQSDDQGVVSNVKVSSYYAACSIMGGLILRDPATPLTRKNIVGFSGLAGQFKYNNADKDYMAATGITILEEYGNVIIVRHGMTCDTTTPNKNEISVVQIKDYVAKMLRMSLENSFVGRKIVPETIVGIKAATEAQLGRLQVNQIIYGFKSVSVTEDPYDPTQLNVDFQMKPIYPLNYIMITITLNARIGA